jgi:prepilin-type N-terminal cleavage/methylation domain-containing protein
MTRHGISSRRRNSSGFTLIELVVATVLAGIVLMGTFSILTSMVTAEVNGMRTGTVTAWSLAGINAMSSDIASSGALAYPPMVAGANSDDYLVVCTNWTSKPGYFAVVDPTQGNTVYSYCLDTTDAAPSPFANAILRNRAPHAGAACSAAPLAPCTGGVYGSDSIVATGVYRSDAASTNIEKIFTTDLHTLNAVRINFLVGNPVGTAVSAGGNGGTVTPVPVSVPFNTEIILED